MSLAFRFAATSSQREVARLGGHLGIKEHLQEQIAELVLQVWPGAAFDGVEDLVGLFEGMLLDGVEGLLAVPGTASRPAQARHDGDSFGEGAAPVPPLARSPVQLSGFWCCSGAVTCAVRA